MKLRTAVLLFAVTGLTIASCAPEPQPSRDPLDPAGRACYCTYGTNPFNMSTEKTTKDTCEVVAGTCSFR